MAEHHPAWIEQCILFSILCCLHSEDIYWGGLCVHPQLTFLGLSLMPLNITLFND